MDSLINILNSGIDIHKEKKQKKVSDVKKNATEYQQQNISD